MPTLLIVQVGLDRILTDFNTRDRERRLALVPKNVNEGTLNSGFDHEELDDEGRVRRSLRGTSLVSTLSREIVVR